MNSEFNSFTPNNKSIDPRVKQIMRDSGCSLDDAIASLNLDPDEIFDQDSFHMYINSLDKE